MCYHKGFYASHLEEVPRSLNSTVPSVTPRDSALKERLAWLPPGDAKPDQAPSLNMPETPQPPSSSDSGRTSGSSSRSNSRSQSQSNLSRRFSGRSSSRTLNVQPFAPVPSSSLDAPAPSPTSQHHVFVPPLPQYHSPPPYGPVGGYMGPYTASSPPHMGMMSAPYTYVHPHGFSPQASSQNAHIGYSASHMMSVVQSPMYQHQGQQSSEGRSSVGSHSFSNPGSVTFYTHMNTSPPPYSAPPHPTPYSGSNTYRPMRYSPSSHFPYPDQPYIPANLYQSGYAQPPYPGQYGAEQEGHSTWWYLPHGPRSGQFDNVQPQFHQGHYQTRLPPMGNLNLETDPYSQAGPRTPYSQSPHQHQPQYSPPQGASVSRDKSPALSPPPILPPGSPGIGAGSKPDSAMPQGRSRERLDTVRRAYHPSPSSQRSEWVMWAGNVPSDATHDELWRFFNQAPKPGTSTSGEVSGGVSSIFLISRSNCAFVNFETEEHLQAAISRFSGQQVRPGDAKCPHLVCRVRRKDDDLKAGVGGQRGVGLHTKWVRQQKGKAAVEGREGESTSPSKPRSPGIIGALFASSDEEGNTSPRHPGTYSSSSGSYASTNSSLLTQYFPHRYFILKSLTQVRLSFIISTCSLTYR
jgi:hypothetical protein